MRKQDLKSPVNEGLADLAQRAEMDHEVQMARADLYKIAKYAIKLHDMLKGVSEEEGLMGWQQAKITKASDYISSVYHNLDYKMKFEGQVNEAEGCPCNESGSKCTCPKDCPDCDCNSMNEDEYKSTLAKKLAEKAESKAQRRAAAIALKHKKEGTKPEAGTASAEMMNMSIADLEDFASGSEEDLPDRAD